MTRSARRWRHTAGAAALSCLVAAGAAACGSSSAPAGPQGGNGASATATPRQVVLASAARTARANTAQVKLVITVSGTPSGGLSSPAASSAGTQPPLAFAIDATGSFDFADKSGSMTLTLPATQGAGTQSVMIRVIGPTLYLSVPALTAADGGKPWVSVNLSSYLQKQGNGGGALGDLSTGDPTQILGLLQQASGDVTTVGPATVDGVATTHYRGTIDLSKTTPSAPAGTSVASPAQLQQLEHAFGLGSLPVDVWVDSQGRARQVQVRLSLLGLTVSVTMNLGDFGAPVSVTAPPSDQTADGSGLLAGGQLGSILQ